MALIEILRDNAGARNRRVAFGDQHRRRAGGVQHQKRLAPFPGPLLLQTKVQTVLAKYEPYKARMRAEWVMKQREHAALDKFLGLKKASHCGRLVPAFRFEVPVRVCRGSCRNFKSAALAAEVRQTTEACDRGNLLFSCF